MLNALIEWLKMPNPSLKMPQNWETPLFCSTKTYTLRLRTTALNSLMHLTRRAILLKNKQKTKPSRSVSDLVIMNGMNETKIRNQTFI